jgi:putative transcriptional regulator
MKDSEFTELIQGIREAGSYLRGQKGGVAKVDRIDPSGVASICGRLKFSQPQFARLLGVGVGTLRHWEQGERQPTGAARVLLRVAAKHPKAILEAVA